MANQFAVKYARGAITNLQDLVLLITEARKEKKAIRLYKVGQMGNIDFFYLTSKSKYIKAENIPDASWKSTDKGQGMVTGFSDHARLGRNETKERWFKDYILIGTYDIDNSSGYDPEHRLFSNRLLAEKYSNALGNDLEYVKDVQEHWKRCNALFNAYDDFRD